MGRYSPTVLPVYPVPTRGRGDYLFEALGEGIESYMGAREERQEEESRRGFLESLLSPAYNPDVDHPLKGRKGVEGIQGYPEEVALGQEPGFPGGAPPLSPDVEGVASMAGDASRRGRVPPPRKVPPGAYNPMTRGFEPAQLFDPQAVPAEYLDEAITAAMRERGASMTRSREAEEATRAERERERELTQFWQSQGETPERARMLATMEMLEPGVTPHQQLEGERKTRETTEATARNQTEHQAYAAELERLGQRPPPFDPDVDWGKEFAALVRANVTAERSDRLIRGRESARGAGDALSETRARGLVDDVFGGTSHEREITSGGTGYRITPESSYEDEEGSKVTAAEVLNPFVYDRLVQDLKAGRLSPEELQRRAPEIAAGRYSGTMEGEIEGPSADVTTEARSLVADLPPDEARALLAEEGFSESEIAEIVGP